MSQIVRLVVHTVQEIQEHSSRPKVKALPANGIQVFYRVNYRCIETL